MNTKTDTKTTYLAPQLQLGGVTKQLAGRLVDIDKLTGQVAAQRSLVKWAEEQQRSLTAIQRVFSGSVGKPGTLGVAAALAGTGKPGLIGAGTLGKSSLGELGFNVKDIGVSAALAKSLACRSCRPRRHSEDAASGDFRVKGWRKEQVVDLLALRAVLVGPRAPVAREVLVLGDVLEICLRE